MLKKKVYKRKIYVVGSKKQTKLRWGVFGIKACEVGYLTEKQLEATRRVITRKTKRSVKVWIRKQIDFPITKKSSAARMGKGVGAVKEFVGLVKAGEVIIEAGKSSFKDGPNILALAKIKLPFECKVIKKEF